MKLAKFEDNNILASLSASAREHIEPHLISVEMPLGEVLYESGRQQRYIYFPTSSIVSLLYVTEDGHSADIAMVGKEGVLGVCLFMGGNSTPNRAVVQSAGHTFRLSADKLNTEFILGRLIHALVTALHPGVDHTDGADGRLQSSSLDTPTTLSLAADEYGSAVFEQSPFDPGVDCQ